MVPSNDNATEPQALRIVVLVPLRLTPLVVAHKLPPSLPFLCIRPNASRLSRDSRVNSDILDNQCAQWQEGSENALDSTMAVVDTARCS